MAVQGPIESLPVRGEHPRYARRSLPPARSRLRHYGHRRRLRRRLLAWSTFHGLFDRSGRAVDRLDVGAKVGANMRRRRDTSSDVGPASLQVDAMSGGIRLRLAAALG